MTPGIVVLYSAIAMVLAVAIGCVRYAQLCGPDDPFDLPENAPWDGLDKLIFFTAIGSSCGISLGCLWALGSFLGRALL